jgi:ATP-binding cassette, subfamily C (CFTR/MRP), member 1
VFALTALEHNRTIRPSSLISIYLLASILADSVQIRTLYIRKYIPSIARLLVSSATGKTLLLLVESLPKTSYLRAIEPYGLEEIIGVFGRSVLWWLNSLFLTGSRKVLCLSDLFPLDRQLRSKELKSRMIQHWEKSKDSKYRLLFVICSCFSWELSSTLIPRAFMIGFTYSQTFLIATAIHYLETPSDLRDKNNAYGLVGAAGLIYVGLALSTVQYYLKVYRTTTAFRGAMISMIYSKSLSIQSDFQEAAPVTLMSTDIDQVASGLVSGLEVPTLFLQVVIGIWLLWRQLGPIAIAPILLVVICSLTQTWISKISRLQADKMGTSSPETRGNSLFYPQIY